MNVFTKLYGDCINASLMSAQIEPTRIGIHEFVESVDERCLGWAVVWYSALMGQDVVALPEAVVDRIGANRLRILKDLRAMLQKEALR